MAIRPFGRDWFVRHQGRLLWWLNTPVLRYWFRWVLRINGNRSAVGGRAIISILPHAIWWEDGESFVAEFRTHAKFAKRLYYALEPLWWAMHFWDWLVADRWVPRLSFGLSTLTKYPDADPETTTVDGQTEMWLNDPAGGAWSSLRDGAGLYSSDNDATRQIIALASGTTSSMYKWMLRSIFLFDTSALTSNAVIDSATMSLYGYTGNNNNISGTAPNVNVYTSNPASNTAVAPGDFDSFGTTAQCDTAIGYSSWSTSGYNDFALNTTGIGNVNKVGVTKFGIRNANYDVANTAWTWGNSTTCEIFSYFADQTGTANDPKLAVTYTPTFPGAINSAGSWISVRTIEKVITGGFAAVDSWISVRTIEKIVTGGFAAVDSWTSTRLVSKVATGSVTATLTWASPKIIDISLTGTLSSVMAWLADRNIEKYVDGSITAVDTWTAAITGVRVDQEYFRYFRDDGNEASATALEALNVNRTGAANEVVRLRFLVYVTGVAGDRQYQLEWRREGTSDWRKVIQ